MIKKMKRTEKLALIGFIFSMLSTTGWAQSADDKYGKEPEECKTKISLYREVFKQKNYKDAYEPWKWVKDNCPMSTKNIFLNGPDILEYKIKEAGDDTVLREQYIKELFDLFDLRIKCYPQDEGYALGRIGVYLYKYYPKKEYQRIYEVLGQSIDLDGDKTSAQVLNVYFIASENKMKLDKLPTEIMIDAYDKITDVLNSQIDTCELKHEASMRAIYKLREDLDSGLVTKEEYDVIYEERANDSAKTANAWKQYINVSNNLDLRFSKYAQCDVLMDIYGKKFESNKTDERLLKQIIKFFAKQGCTDNQLFADAVEAFYQIKPNANLAFNMARINMKKKAYSAALNYLNEAISMYEKESDKITAYIIMIECQKQLNQYSAARETAYKILKLNPNDGRAYMLIGDLYAASGGACSGLDIPASVYWAAVDKYNKAKAIDPSVAEDAQKRISSVSGRFPAVSTYFQLGLKKGDSYRVGCWINETTTIR